MGPAPDIGSLHSLKVDGFFPDTRKEEVWELFERCGKIGDVYLPREHSTQQNRGFAFVRFHEKKDAEMAVQDMDGQDFQGNKLRVNFAQVARGNDPRSRGKGGGRRRSRSRSRRRRRRSDSRRSRSRRRRDSRSRSRGRGRGRGRDRDSRSRSRKKERSKSRSRSRSGDRDKKDNKARKASPSRSRS
eukprot:TRINITY_DN5759_c0_g1_i1.p1 TRINITY_DN5759_c0_g1~~TRINITY_DN5759_c0_g1_i1.p1  ORF type:complete len:187 (+),score=26.37 TRINITY_DN5759_c0_g1_i1:175-735(+)